MDPHSAYTDLTHRVREIALLNSCAGVLGWDERTYMPHAGSAHRGEQMALLAQLAHDQMTAPVVGEQLARLESSGLVADPGSQAAANLREIRRIYDRAVKLPRAWSKSWPARRRKRQQVWQEAEAEERFRRVQAMARHDRPPQARGGERGRLQGRALRRPARRIRTRRHHGGDHASIFAALREELAPLAAAIAASKRRPKRGHPAARHIPWTGRRSSVRRPPRPSASTSPPAAST